MKKMVGPLIALLVVAVAIGAYIFTTDGSVKHNKTVSMAFPGGQPIWQRHADNVKGQLEKDGFKVVLEFAETEQAQNEQLEKMIADGTGCLVIGAVNGSAMTEVLEKAEEKNIPVIAFDRLIMNSKAVDYYVSFDNDAVGSAMGQYIEAALNLKGGAGPFNIEVFAGDPNDNNAHLFFSGAMDVLTPYIKSGQLVCRSNELDFDRVSTANWDGKNATARMEKLYKTYYADGGTIDVILAPNDGVSAGIRAGLANAGYTGTPIITGQDCDEVAMKDIPEGKQSMSIYKSPEQLGMKCVRMVKAVVEGTEPTINDVTTYNNGVIVVPSYLCIPMIIDKTNTNLVK